MKHASLEFYLDQSKNAESMSWNDNIKSWVVLDAELAASVLKSSNFLIEDPAPNLQRIAENNGIAIPRILESLQDVPLALNGDSHTKARKQFAQQLAPRLSAVAQRFGEECNRLLPLVLGPGQSVELFFELLFPALDAALAPLGGKAIPAELFKVVSPSQLVSVSQIFSGARLQRLEAEVGAAPEASQAAKLGQIMTFFARDPTLGSIGASLVEIIKTNPRQRLCDIDWPSQFTRSSQPFAVRVAAVDTELAGNQVRQGDKITVYLGAFENDGDLYFGVGPHRCIGEALAKLLWERFRAAISMRSERLEIEDVQYRAGDVVFAMPVKIQVTVTT